VHPNGEAYGPGDLLEVDGRLSVVAEWLEKVATDDQKQQTIFREFVGL